MIRISAFPFTLTKRRVRMLVYGGFAWLGIELFLFWSASKSFGILPTLGFVTLKGGLGLLLFGATIRRGFRALAAGRIRGGLAGTVSTAFAAAGAFLILLPGFLTTFAGLALFSHSVRSFLLHWFTSARRQKTRDGILDLSAKDYTEVSVRRKRQPRIKTTDPVVRQ